MAEATSVEPGALDAQPAPPASTRHSSLRTGAWVAFGAGAAGLLGSAITFSMRQSALNALGADCPKYASLPCDPESQAAVTSDVNQGRTASTLLNVFGTLAVAGIATGVVLYTLSARGTDTQTAIVVTPTGAGAVGVF